MVHSLKKFNLILIFFAVFMLLASTCLAAKPIIESDSNYFDVNTGKYYLEGNVYVKTGRREITADKAQVSVTSLEVWAQGNIKLIQDGILFTGQDLYVVGRRSTAYIKGGIDFERDGLSITADAGEFNWDTKVAVFNGNVKMTNGDETSTTDTLSYDMRNFRVIE